MAARTASFALAVIALVGCSKLRGDSGDGGESSGGGGVLSFLSGGAFEGEIALQMQDKRSGKPPHTLIYEVKQPKMRLDMPQDVVASAGPGSPVKGKSVWMLVDPPQKKMWAVTDDEKKAIVFDLDKMAEDMKKMRGSGAPHTTPGSSGGKPPPKIEKTGKKDKVCGYTCDIWTITDENKKTELCAAEGIKWFDLRSMGGLSDPRTVALAELTDMNHFPLRVIQTENGAETERMEATRCEKKTMADARFVVPPGYQIIDLAQMMQGLGGMPSGRPPIPPPHKR
jgi:Domain of unknown function (DUF4412)